VKRRAINRASLRGLINEGMRHIGPESEHEQVTDSSSVGWWAVEALGNRLPITLAEVTDGAQND
jgi:hypothetical protein